MKKAFFATLFVFTLSLSLFLGKNKLLSQDCPPESLRSVIVEIPFTISPQDTAFYDCFQWYGGLCRYLVTYCVQCGLTEPSINISRKEIKLLDYGQGRPKGYVCYCNASLRYSSKVALIEKDALDKLLRELVNERICGLNYCDGDPPSQTITATIKEAYCYNMKYEPNLDCIGPVSLEACPEELGYCEKTYQVCVDFDLNGQAFLKKILISERHYGGANCAPIDEVLPPGTPFPRYGLCNPDETGCIFFPTDCE